MMAMRKPFLAVVAVLCALRWVARTVIAGFDVALNGRSEPVVKLL